MDSPLFYFLLFSLPCLFSPSLHFPVSSLPSSLHISAGVGRTGAFIAMDVLSGVVGEGGAALADPAAVVRALRECRFKMVQTVEQVGEVISCDIFIRVVCWKRVRGR